MFGTSDLKEAARAEINEFNGLNIYLELLQVIFFFSLKKYHSCSCKGLDHYNNQICI